MAEWCWERHKPEEGTCIRSYDTVACDGLRCGASGTWVLRSDLQTAKIPVRADSCGIGCSDRSNRPYVAGVAVSE